MPERFFDLRPFVRLRAGPQNDKGASVSRQQRPALPLGLRLCPMRDDRHQGLACVGGGPCRGNVAISELGGRKGRHSRGSVFRPCPN